MRLVRIVWRDSGLSHDHGWQTAAQIENRTVLVQSVGLVVHEDDENVTIATGHSAELDLWYGIHTIWRRAIESIRDLSVDPSISLNTEDDTNG